MGYKATPPLDRIANLIDMTGGPDSCWPFLGSCGKYGYGRFPVPGVGYNAHRVLWLLTVGPIEQGLHLDHLCRNPVCCNPDHLEPVAPAENNRRGTSRSAKNIGKVECWRGHPFNEGNTGYGPTGNRQCKKCAALRARARKDRNLAAGLTSRGGVRQKAPRGPEGTDRLESPSPHTP